MRRVRAGMAAVLGSALVQAWRTWQRRDEEAVRADPEHAALAGPPPATELSVESADGTRLHAEVSGRADGPTVVLIHGWSCSIRFWTHQRRRLADDYRLVAYDLRGHGRSQRGVGDDHSADALAADLDAVLRTCVPEGERAVVVGHSMGGVSVVAWAGVHRDDVLRRLAGVVLVDTGVRRLIAEARMGFTAYAPLVVRMAVGRTLIGFPLPLPDRPNPLLRRAMRYIALNPEASAAQVEFCSQMVLDTPTRVRAAFGIMLSGLDLAHALEAVTAPTVVIVGADDRLTPPAQARALVEAIPGSSLVELPKRGHMTPIEAPEAVTDQVRALVERTRAEGRAVCC